MVMAGAPTAEVGHDHLVGQVGWEGAAPRAIAIAIGEVGPGDVSRVPIQHRDRAILCVWAMAMMRVSSASVCMCGGGRGTYARERVIRK